MGFAILVGIVIFGMASFAITAISVLKCIEQIHRVKTEASAESVKAAADAMGLEFIYELDLNSELEGCELVFNTGYDKKFVNCFGGVADQIEFKIFEHKFCKGYGKHKRCYSQTVAYINVADLELPQFFIKSKRLPGFLTSEKPFTTFEIDAVFSTHSWASSVEPLKAKKLFTPEFKYLVRQNGWSVESNNGRLLVYRALQTVPAENQAEFMRQSLDVMGILESAKQESADQSFVFSAAH